MSFHKDETIGSIHIPYDIEVASTSARTSRTYVSAEVGKIVYQTNNNSLWMVLTTTPTFIEILTATITSEAAGDVIYFDGTNWKRLAKDAGKYLKSGASAVSWDTPAGGGGLSKFSVSFSGNMYVGTLGFIDFTDTKTVTRVDLQVGTAPVDATFILDIHKNGTTIFTNQAHRPQITTGNTTGYTTDIDVSTIANGDRYTFIVDQVGSTTPGADLGVRVSYS